MLLMFTTAALAALSLAVLCLALLAVLAVVGARLSRIRVDESAYDECVRQRLAERRSRRASVPLSR